MNAFLQKLVKERKKYYKRETTPSNKETEKMWKRIKEYYNKY